MKNSSFLTRTISAIALVIILLLVGIMGGEALLLFCIIVSTVGLKELYEASGVFLKDTDDKKNNLLAIAGFILCLIFYVLTFLLTSIERMIASVNITLEQYFTGYVIAVILVMAAIYVFSFPRFNFEKFSYAFFGAVYLPVFVVSIFQIRNLSNGAFVFWLVFISSWICDTCAYLVGSSIGKHKLAPILSPKKSIEGAIGGVAGSVLVAFIFGYFVEYKLFHGKNNVMTYMIIAFLGAIISQVGDLFASAIKRNRGIKDYGNIIPGHGGILDRFDSVIFISPIIHLLAVLFIH